MLLLRPVRGLWGWCVCDMYSVKTSHHHHRDKKMNKESGCDIVDGDGPKGREWDEGFVRWVVDLVWGLVP